MNLSSCCWLRLAALKSEGVWPFDSVDLQCSINFCRLLIYVCARFSIFVWLLRTDTLYLYFKTIFVPICLTGLARVTGVQSELNARSWAFMADFLLRSLINAQQQRKVLRIWNTYRLRPLAWYPVWEIWSTASLK